MNFQALMNSSRLDRGRLQYITYTASRNAGSFMTSNIGNLKFD
jgi:hypothetical protein